MEIHFVESISSTHIWLCKAIKNNNVNASLALYAGEQTEGIGSRENRWESERGNLFLSIAVPCPLLPQDLPHASVTIYFAQLMLDFLRERGSRAWLKWPNDLYIDNRKLGGALAAKIKNFFVFSIGINLLKAKKDFATLDIALSARELVEGFIKTFEIFPSWKHIFSKYELEFHLSQNLTAHIDGEKVSLSEAKLCSDGSIEINNKKVYSLR